CGFLVFHHRRRMENTATVTEAGTRERMLEAARRWLFREGYQALTMDQLARDMGVSKKTLYVHFSGKEELVNEVIEAFAREILSLADDIFSDESLPYVARLTRFTTALSETFTRL